MDNAPHMSTKLATIDTKIETKIAIFSVSHKSRVTQSKSNQEFCS